MSNKSDSIPHKTNSMPDKSKLTYPEIQEIRDDLDSLRTNVVELTRHIRAEGSEQAHVIVEKARKKLFSFQKAGRKELDKIENRIKAKPAQSLAIAFAIGAVASRFLRRSA